ncbi:MAG TPA: c-type cytochrome, partial [Longimicrobiaceae bacterium]|nr:c-type cytochrome [Longimicrobiaceae bacterium]
VRDGRIEHREIPRLGQWGLSTDDYGRIYRNFNESPLHADLVPAHYLERNPALTRPRGAYELLAENGPVWPIRPTPGVNRGYREGILRENRSLAQFTAAGSPVVYRGDRLPEELRGSVFVSEPAGNLVRRFAVTENPDGTLSAHNPYDSAEFLASTDERFRPVNFYSAPDGTLLVVDMYRGVIQHRDFLTDYLVEQIRGRGLEQPLGHGRIYRIVHRSTRRDRPPGLSGRSPEELVGLLAHPNGWWRSRAQQLLVERGNRSVAASLRRLALSASDERTRLHALWTLEGLDEADPATLAQALSDVSPHVRAAALRIAEPYLAHAEHPLRAAVLQRLEDSAPVVRWQLAASLGELPAEQRVAPLVEMLTRYGEDPILVDVAISGLAGQELAALERVLAETPTGREGAVARLAATVLRADRADEVQRLLSWIGEEARPRWQRLGLLEGWRELVPESAGAEVSPIRLDRRPVGLLAAASSADAEVRARAERIVRFLDWPGNPNPLARPAARPLTPEEQQQFEEGGQQYQTTCAPCHQESGMGMPGLAKRLVGSSWVLGDSGRLIRIVLHGKEGEMLMPPFGAALSDEEMAAVLTYIRRAWDHQASPIRSQEVQEVRGYTAGRSRPWTEEELMQARR